MNHQTYTPLDVLLLLAVLLLAVAPVTAQTTTEAAANQTVPDGAPDTVELVLDDDVAVTDYSYADGVFTLSVYSDAYTTMTVAGSPEKGQQSGSASFKTVPLKKGATTKVQIESPTAVNMWTEKSIEDGRWYYVTKPSSGLISGPWDGSDVRDAGIGGALGVMLTVLYTAVEAKTSGGRRGERVA